VSARRSRRNSHSSTTTPMALASVSPSSRLSRLVFLRGSTTMAFPTTLVSLPLRTASLRVSTRPTETRTGKSSSRSFATSSRSQTNLAALRHRSVYIPHTLAHPEALADTQDKLAMAWVLSNPRISSAIMGASKVEQVHEAIKSLDIVPKLTKEVLDEIDTIMGNKPEPLTMRF